MGRASIKFTQAGVQPPVYVVTSLSSPPWEPLEMSVDDEKTESGDSIFVCAFDNVAEGSHQYKVRIGETHWVVDESKDIAIDDAGNRNNIVTVKSDSEAASVRSAADATAKEKRWGAGERQHVDPRPEAQSSHLQHPATDTSALSSNTNPEAQYMEDPTQVPAVPVPFVVVDKVPDKDQPGHGLTETQNLQTDDSKRVADADPDFETVKPDSPVEVNQSPLAPPAPRVIVEKSDSAPAYGDDFGEQATSAQKLAHELRAADATPDQVLVPSKNKPVDSPIDDHSPKMIPEKIKPSHIEPGTAEEQAAPLFRHESFESVKPVDPISGSNAPMDTIDEESTKSSTDQTSSEADVHTPAEDDSGSELEHDLLMPHETSLSHGKGAQTELPDAPLLSHEISLSESRGSGDTRSQSMATSSSNPGNGEDEQENEISELDRVPSFPHEALYGDEYGSDAPLLPHGQSSVSPSIESSDYHLEEGTVTEDGEQTFDYEIAAPHTFIGPSHSSPFFTKRMGGGSSSLPHSLPPSDNVDPNLHDPSLETFPTSRDQIIERVATIRSHLPEDEATEPSHDTHSPLMTVLSQACSSADLASPTPHTPLKSVVEEPQEPNEAPELPSPILPKPEETAPVEPISPAVESSPALDPVALPSYTRASNKPTDTAKTDKTEQQAFHMVESSETDSVQKNDGANDASKEWDNLYDSLATPTSVLEPLTPPLTPEKKDAQKEKDNDASKSTFADHTRAPTSESMRITSAPPREWEQYYGDHGKPVQSQNPVNDDRNSTPSNISQPDTKKENFFKTFIRIVFGPIGRFLAALVGGRKQAGGAIMVVGIAIAAYYYLYVLGG